MNTWQIGLAFGGAAVALWLLNRIATTIDELNKRMKRMMVVMEEMNNRENVRDLDAKYRRENEESHDEAIKRVTEYWAKKGVDINK
jgi:sugar (pentulose or hexulose) kinase